jgi:hypothetical protein
MVREPLRLPDDWGVKLTSKVQLPDGAILSPQVVVYSKSPAMSIEYRATVSELLVLIKVIVCGAMLRLPTSTSENTRLLAEIPKLARALLEANNNRQKISEATSLDPKVKDVILSLLRRMIPLSSIE